MEKYKFYSLSEKFLYFTFYMVCIYLVYNLFCMFVNVVQASYITASPNEVRDFVLFRIEKFISNGNNPYKIESISSLPVPLLYQYSFFPACIVALFLKITGIPIVPLNYLINIVLLFLTAFNLFLILNTRKHRLLLYMLIFINVSIMFTMFNIPAFTFRPDGIGICLSTFIMFLLYKYDHKYFLISVLSVFLLLTKQFLLLTTIPITMYYFFKNKNYCYKYVICVAIELLFAIIFIQIFFPLYWTNNILSQYASASYYYGLKVSLNNIYHEFVNYVYLLAPVVLLLLIARKKIDAPARSFIIFLVISVINSVFFLLIIAQSGGDGPKYCRDLLSPSLFLLLLCCLKDMQIKSEGLKRCLFFTFLLISTCFAYGHFGKIVYTKQDLLEYQKYYYYLDQFKDKNVFLGVGATSYLTYNSLFEKDNFFFDDGHIEYFRHKFKNPLHLSLYEKEVRKIAKSYISKLDKMLDSKKFDLVVLTPYTTIISKSILKRNYVPFKKYHLKDDSGIISVTLFRPVFHHKANLLNQN